MERLLPKPRGFADHLRDRLRTLDTQSDELRANLKVVEDERELVGKLLDIEERRSGKRAVAGKREIREIVDSALLNGPVTKDELRQEAEKNGHAKPLRSIHATLMGYERHSYVAVGGNRFILTPKGREALSRIAEGSQ